MFKCVLSQSVMRNPAMLIETTNSFEHHMIYQHVVKGGKRVDPKTQERFESP